MGFSEHIDTILNWTELCEKRIKARDRLVFVVECFSLATSVQYEVLLQRRWSGAWDCHIAVSDCWPLAWDLPLTDAAEIVFPCLRSHLQRAVGNRPSQPNTIKWVADEIYLHLCLPAVAALLWLEREKERERESVCVLRCMCACVCYSVCYSVCVCVCFHTIIHIKRRSIHIDNKQHRSNYTTKNKASC